MNLNESNPVEINVEKFSSKILLHFSRHAEKNKAGDLTEGGKLDAKERAEETNTNQSVAFGSARTRTQHTAALKMVGAHDSITGNETFDELKLKVNENLNMGSKIAVEPNLDFVFEKGSYFDEFDKEISAADKRQEGMKWLIEESDTLAEKYADKNSSTYSRMAASIAKIILKYVQISKRWDELVAEDSSAYEPELQRFLGTSMTMQECFLAKIIEKTKGIKERDRFVSVIKNGFDFTEGFEVEILNTGVESDPLIHVSYKREGENGFEYNENVPLQVLSEITANLSR